MEEVMAFMVEKLKALPKILPPTMAEKINPCQLAVKSAGETALTWLNSVLPPEARAEKIEICKNSGEAALAWFNKACPPETRARWPKAKLFIGAVVAIMAFRFFFGGGGGGGAKMMKAPGRGHRIPRRGFEENPRGYFRELRDRE